MLTDFLMIILKDLIKIRSDLKVILMSATANAEELSAYWSSCPILSIPGRIFPVQEYFLEDVVEMLRYEGGTQYNSRTSKFRNQERMKHEQWLRSLSHTKYSSLTIQSLKRMESPKVDINLITKLVEYVCRNYSEGAILVFLPGWGEINDLNRALGLSPTLKCMNKLIIPLHSLMPTINQRQVFEKTRSGVRKIILATNIAETSITIDDIVYVIDSGRRKLKKLDLALNVAKLEIDWVSKASATQRKGRAGRCQAGVCFHLISGFQYERLDEFDLPEILRTRLEEVCLHVKLLKLGKIVPFLTKGITKPEEKALENALKTLVKIHALTEEEELTALGWHIARMPVDPHCAKMLIFAGLFSCVDPILTIAAALSYKDAFYFPLSKEQEVRKCKKNLDGNSQSDHLLLARAFSGWEKACSNGAAAGNSYCDENFLSKSVLNLLSGMRRQLAALLRDMGFVSSSDPYHGASNYNSSNEKLVRAVLSAGLYPNVVKIRYKNSKPKPYCPRYIIESESGGKKIHIHKSSVNFLRETFSSTWLVYHLKMATDKLYIFNSTPVSPYSLFFFGGQIQFKREKDQDCIVVDDWIVFRCSQKIANLIGVKIFITIKLVYFSINFLKIGTEK